MSKYLLPLAALLALGTPALANDAAEEGARQVLRYNMATLEQPDARRALQRRIDLAARNVCGESIIASKEEIDAIRACRAKATAMAHAQVPVKLASSD